MSETGGFVGRDTEMARLRAALDAATRMVLVAGDAGVGKTRLILEMTRGAEAAGSIVLSGECLPVSEPLPMLPVASALGALARRDDGALMESALRAAPGYARGEVGRLLPQYGPGETGHGGDLQRSRLFAGIAALLTGLAQLSPVCVVVEDVHWADAQTLDLLTFLARSATPRVTFIVTCRGDEFPLSADVADWLAATRAAAGMEEITLGPLSPADTGALVTALTGHPVLPELAAELHVRAEGNPFSPSSLSPQRWLMRLPGIPWRFRRDCRPGSPACSPRERIAVPGPRGSCWPPCRLPAGRCKRSSCVSSPAWTERMCATACGNFWQRSS